MEPVTPQPQLSAPAISLATLRAILAKGQAAHPDLASRMDKAAHIVATRTIERCPSGWWVESETTQGQWYLVQALPGVWRCTCKDHERRQSWCKHALAVALLRRCEEHEARQAPIPLPARTLRDDEPIPYELTDRGLAAIASGPVPAA